jgi:hypothetical protein
MRSSIAIASGLFALNLAVLDRAESPPIPAPSFADPPIDVREMTSVRDTATPALAGDALVLADLWRAAHPNEPLPACHLRDPVAILDAHLDATPGREHVIGNRRFGIAMYSEAGELLAWMEPVQCFGYSGVEDQSLSLGTIGNTLIASERTISRVGEEITAYVIRRRADKLVDVARIDAGGDRRYYEGEWQVDAKLYPDPEMITVKYHGRFRPTGERAWRAVDAHCRLEWNGQRFEPIDPERVCHHPH